MKFEEVSVLRRRSEEFLQQAEMSLRSSAYDAAVFLSEISLQLYLKSVLLEAVGDYPRNSIRALLSANALF